MRIYTKAALAALTLMLWVPSAAAQNSATDDNEGRRLLRESDRLRAAGRLEEARKLASEAEKLVSGPGTFRRIGEIEEDMGHPGAAARQFQKALTLAMEAGDERVQKKMNAHLERAMKKAFVLRVSHAAPCPEDLNFLVYLGAKDDRPRGAPYAEVVASAKDCAATIPLDPEKGRVYVVEAERSCGRVENRRFIAATAGSRDEYFVTRDFTNTCEKKQDADPLPASTVAPMTTVWPTEPVLVQRRIAYAGWALTGAAAISAIVVGAYGVASKDGDLQVTSYALAGAAGALGLSSGLLLFPTFEPPPALSPAAPSDPNRASTKATGIVVIGHF